MLEELINLESKRISDVIDFSNLKDKSILVTGAAGVVGVFLISSLKQVQQNLNIKIFAWTNNELPEYLKPTFEGCTVIIGDITDSTNFDNLPHFDYIIHAAGYGQPLKFVRNKIKTIQINTDVTTRLFSYLKPGGSFLFISSSEVYNGLESANLTENLMGNTNTDHFRSCYIEGKKCGESICHAFMQDGFNVKIARLSLAYGPGTRVDDERVINTFIKKGITNDSIELMDTGSAIRTYCYITDAVEMMWNILLHGKSTVYNIGGTSVTTILNLAEIIASLLNKPIHIPDINAPLEGNPKIVNISCDKYIQEFNKQNFIHLFEGVEKVILWYKILFNNESRNN
jgi:nucleoside-diphosphate-sugar epimerase